MKKNKIIIALGNMAYIRWMMLAPVTVIEDNVEDVELCSNLLAFLLLC